MAPPPGMDTTNPAVREYITLTRLQVLTPLSMLINIAAVGICAFVVSPSLSRVSEMYPTSLTPSPSMILSYVAAIFVGQIGYCILLVGARREATRQALIKATGYELVVANWVMAFWAIAWTIQWFILAAILAGTLAVILLYANLVLMVYHPPVLRRPIDILLLHAPLRLFLILPLTITFPHSVFIAIHHYWTEGSTKDYHKYAWEGFAVLLTVNLIGLVVIAVRRDVVWAAAATWLAAAVWNHPPKSAQVSITALVFMFAHPSVLLVTFVWSVVGPKRRTGPIALPADDSIVLPADDRAPYPAEDRAPFPAEDRAAAFA